MAGFHLAGHRRTRAECASHSIAAAAAHRNNSSLTAARAHNSYLVGVVMGRIVAQDLPAPNSIGHNST
jgi:hypothetical protein